MLEQGMSPLLILVEGPTEVLDNTTLATEIQLWE